jgi:hypothetical protein
MEWVSRIFSMIGRQLKQEGDGGQGAAARPTPLPSIVPLQIPVHAESLSLYVCEL